MSARPPKGLELAIVPIGFIVGEEFEDIDGVSGDADLPGVKAMFYFDRDTEHFEVWVSVCGIQTKYTGDINTPALKQMVRRLIEATEDGDPGEPPYLDPDVIDARRQNAYEAWLDRNG